MSDEVIRLGDDYVGVFTCNEFNTAEQWPPVDGAQFWAFESAVVSYAFIVGGQHPEPVAAWLRAAHNVQIGDSMLAVPVRGGRALPNDADNYLFHLPLSDIVSTNVLADVLTSDRFLLYLPHSDQILLMTSAYDGLHLSRLLGQRYAQPATGLVRTTHVAMPASSRRRRAEPYDPLESQIREILGPAT